jgi:coproporphyrinogen III oxidase
MIDPTRLKAYFTDLQTRIVTALETLEGSWRELPRRPLGKGSWLATRGQRLHLHLRGWSRIFERGGVAFSQVSGAALPASATAKRPELAGRAFAAMGVSLVLHPENPYCPTAHMNVRALIATRPMPSPPGGLAAAWT